MKRLISMILALCLLVSVPAFALEPVREDKDFSDTEQSWARDYISLCWTSGLMDGVSDDEFDPNGTLSVAQCAAAAARLHILITGSKDTIKETTPWYEGYADYLEDLGCTLPKNLASDCTRQQFLSLMSEAVPEGVLTPINHISSLPDTADEKILSFYNAGILTGMDEFGTFRGNLTLTRAECAAMLARIADYTLRVVFKPEKGDGSAAMSVLYIPADRTAITIGGYEISAATYTAELTHELEVIAAQYQLQNHPEYDNYYQLWSTGTFAGSFERYLSEVYGINDFTPTDWTAKDEDSGELLTSLALDRAMMWLKSHAAVRTVAERYSVSLSDEENASVEAYLKEGNVKGESRILYTATSLEDTLLYTKLAEKLKATESDVSSKLTSGDYLTAEFIRFDKYDANGGRFSDADIAYIRDGAELFREELQQKPTHFQLEYMAKSILTPFTAPRPTLWAKSDTDAKLWAKLSALQPSGVSAIMEDDDGIDIYLVTNPLSNDALMDEVCTNVGYDRTDEQIQSFIKNPAIIYSDAVRYLSVVAFAAKVI
ncbi:MAG: S-layer homology domain-containing protein [Oscillospiraceae bacterium]